jgi:hypothetical protein
MFPTERPALMRSHNLSTTSLIALALLAGSTMAYAEENQSLALFDGKDLSHWQSANGGAPSAGWIIDGDTLTRQERAGYIWSKERFGDFVLDLEFKTEGNSGVFIRTDDPKNPVQTGIEIQIYNPTPEPSTHSTGALYDLAAPSKEASKPSGQWNHMRITTRDNYITVELNGEQIVEADLDQWTEAGKNPDGSKNKFKTALKDFRRDGHIGFQDHGHMVAFRNVRIKPLGNRQ